MAILSFPGPCVAMTLFLLTQFTADRQMWVSSGQVYGCEVICCVR